MPETDPILFELQRLRADVDELIRGEFNPQTISTWTPAWTGTSTAGVFTYTTQAGFYIRIGPLVFFWANIHISAISTPPVGNMTITGLPVTSSATAQNFGQVFLGYISNFNFTAAALSLTGYIALGTKTINLFETFDNIINVSIPAANFTNAACQVLISGFYPVD